MEFGIEQTSQHMLAKADRAGEFISSASHPIHCQSLDSDYLLLRRNLYKKNQSQVCLILTALVAKGTELPVVQQQ